MGKMRNAACTRISLKYSELVDPDRESIWRVVNPELSGERLLWYVDG